MQEKPSHTVLIVDDNPAGLYVTAKILTTAGYQVLKAANGAEMRSCLLKNPDAIVLDINLPDIDGYTLCKEVKENPATSMIPVIHLSATFTDAGSHITGIQSGAEAFLAQPVHPDLLITTVQSLIQIRDVKLALRESEKKYRQIVELVQEGILVIDEDGIITYVNPRMASMLGYDPSEVTGRDLTSIVDPNKTDFVLEMIEKRKKGISEIHEFEFTKKSGDNVPTLINISPIMSEENRYEGAIALVSDISEQKFALHALKRANQQISFLTAITRHDILNELSIILGQIDLYLYTKDTGSCEVYLQNIEDASRNIQKLIEFTREYERLGSKVPVWQTLSPLITSAFEMNNRDKALTLHLDIDPQLQIFADILLPKVFYLLIENAIRHGEKATTISVSSYCDETGCHIICADDGIGIKDEEKERIFERGHGKNTGLGLFFASEILAVTDCSIRENGVYGEGARFDIIVPKEKLRVLNVSS